MKNPRFFLTNPLTIGLLTPFFCLLLLGGLCIGLRVVQPASDPYAGLTWSSALLTDEGFYMHNARNRILFGQERTDEFNNALLMPTLHYVQVAVFQCWGVGIVQARAISIAAGLLTLPVFFCAMRRAFGPRAAAIATLLLGLDHVPLLYSRMALMDTPTALILVCGYYAWVRSASGPSAVPDADTEINRAVWLALCGLLLGLAFATRGLSAFVVPIPLLLFLRRLRQWGRAALPECVGWVAGLTCALLLYIVLWAVPHHAELVRINAYYTTRQLLPHSLPHLARIVGSFFFGDTRGMSPYLARHTPVLFALTLVGFGAFFLRPQERDSLLHSDAARFLGGWLLAGWLLCGTIGYAPSRYYILFYPALAGVAALSLERLPILRQVLRETRWLRVALAAFFTYHFALVLRPSPDSLPGIFGVAVVTLLAAVVAWRGTRLQFPVPLTARAPLLLWLLVNAVWLGDWAGRLAYTQRDAERWLMAHLPPDTVLVGDAAPGLCMNSRFRAIPVIPGLCNDQAPLTLSAPAPRAIVIMDAELKEPWWTQNYPAQVAPERRTMLRRVVKFPVGIYFLQAFSPPQATHQN